MEPITPGDAALLLGGGLLAGVVNTLAGGGSLLTVPLLVLVGLPGNLANGTNRVCVLLQNLAAIWSFRRAGVSGIGEAAPVLVPVMAGSLLGAFAISRADDATFQRVFGVVMLLLLWPTLRGVLPRRGAPVRPWPRLVSSAVFLAIGLYGGAIQAGVGLLLVLALSQAGSDLVRASSVKVVVVGCLTATALPVFLASGQVAWLPAALLATGHSLGGALGARLTVRGGERLIRPALAAAVLALAGRMLGVY